MIAIMIILHLRTGIGFHIAFPDLSLTDLRIGEAAQKDAVLSHIEETSLA